MGSVLPATTQTYPHHSVRKVDDSGKKAITLNVPQGIGDIFWVYQKFSPYFDLIHFNILVTAADTVQIRAAEWLKLLPKCGSIGIQETPHSRYNAVIEATYSIKEILAGYDQGLRDFDYACNLPLERGVNLYEIDPDHATESDVNIETLECPLHFAGDFIAAYVSGGTKELGAIKAGCWTVNRWCEFFMRFEKEFHHGLPYIFVGASYDREITEYICKHLSRYRIQNWHYIDSYPANVTYILKKAKFFIGYQSGLNIIADNLGTRQFMMYFPKLRPMLYAWCKPGHAHTNFYADTFDKMPHQVIQGLKDHHLTIK